MTLDEAGFNECMTEQRENARNRRKTTNYMGADATVYEELDTSLTTAFVGYDKLEATSKITALTTETEVVAALSDGEVGTIIVQETPFYATMGGQEGDKGTIVVGEGTFEVVDTIKLLGGKVGHVGKVVSGMIKVGDMATLKVDEENRMSTCKNPSATHILQKALRKVLGSHVEQAGSLVNKD